MGNARWINDIKELFGIAKDQTAIRLLFTNFQRDYVIGNKPCECHSLNSFTPFVCELEDTTNRFKKTGKNASIVIEILINNAFAE
jgi:hypothetical protein